MNAVLNFRVSYIMELVKSTRKRLLGRILKKNVSIRGMRLVRLRIGLLESPCEFGIELLGLICYGVC